jgi:hypothetical protein
MTQNEQNDNGAGTIVRVERNGIEYFTVKATGECGMSQRGLARAAGVSHSAIQKLEKNLATKAPSKRLERFVGKDLNLATTFKKNGGDVAIYHVAFCSAVIKHYAYLGNEIAQSTDEATGEIGLTSYIQSVTGWLPAEFKAAPEAHDNLSRILDRPDPWKAFYEKDFCDQVFKWFGAKFYWDYIYNQFTPEEICKINLLNPPRNGVRPHKIHQFITPEIKKRLTPYIRELVTGIYYSPTKQDFIIGYGFHVGGNRQLRLF